MKSLPAQDYPSLGLHVSFRTREGLSTVFASKWWQVLGVGQGNLSGFDNHCPEPNNAPGPCTQLCCFRSSRCEALGQKGESSLLLMFVDWKGALQIPPLRYPGFPVEFGGVGDLHAAFLNESRTRGYVQRRVAGNPGKLRSHGTPGQAG
jgi:hypothetical protein